MADYLLFQQDRRQQNNKVIELDENFKHRGAKPEALAFSETTRQLVVWQDFFNGEETCLHERGCHLTYHF